MTDTPSAEPQKNPDAPGQAAKAESEDSGASGSIAVDLQNLITDVQAQAEAVKAAAQAAATEVRNAVGQAVDALVGAVQAKVAEIRGALDE